MLKKFNKLMALVLVFMMIITLMPTVAVADIATYSIFDAEIPFTNVVDCARGGNIGGNEKVYRFGYVCVDSVDGRMDTVVPDAVANPDNYYYKFLKNGEKINLVLYKRNDANYSLVVGNNGRISSYGEGCFLYISGMNFGSFVSFRDKAYHRHGVSSGCATSHSDSAANCTACGCGETYTVLLNNPNISTLEALPLTDGLVSIPHQHVYDAVTKKCVCGADMPPHSHNWSYAASGATITATCSGEYFCDETNKTLTIVKPTLVRYNDGGNENATIADAKTSVGGVDTLAAINYEKKIGDGTYDAPTTVAPTLPGTYRASITVGGATASVEYTIAKQMNTMAMGDCEISNVTHNSFKVTLEDEEDRSKNLEYCIENGEYHDVILDGSGSFTVTVDDEYIGELIGFYIREKATDLVEAGYKNGKIITLEAPPVIHVHNWSYAIRYEFGNPKIIVATCSGDGICDATNTELTIEKPLHKKVGDGKSAAATLSADSIGDVVMLPQIWYREKDPYDYTQYLGAATVIPPEKGGLFEAYITIEGVKAVVEYTIEKLDREDIKQFTITDITSDTFVINLHEDDIGKTGFECQIGGVYGIEFTPDENGKATIEVPAQYVGSSNLLVAIKQKATDTHKESNLSVVDDLDLLPVATPSPSPSPSPSPEPSESPEPEYKEYNILYNDVDHAKEVLDGVADVTEEDGKIYIKLTSNIKGRIRFDENDGDFVLDLNGKTIKAGTANEAICLDNDFDGRLTITGKGKIEKGINNIIYKGFFAKLEFAVAKGKSYFTLKNGTEDEFEKKNYETKSSDNSIRGEELTISQMAKSYSSGGMTGPLLSEKAPVSTPQPTEKPNAGSQGAAKKEIILTVDKKEAIVFGETKVNDVAPFIVSDRVMLPARFVAENLGAYVEWNAEEQIVTITKDDTTIIIYIGKDVAKVNDTEVKIDSVAFIADDRTFTPLRFIAETLGHKVEWDGENRKVIITVVD